MRIAVVGGGPGGLYFSILMRKVAPDCEVVVYERNRATDAFGFGGADGASSGVRDTLRSEFAPSLDPRHCRYMWMGVDLPFDAFKFFVRETPEGVFQAHAYPYDARMSTFIVETHESTWRAAGLDRLAPGPLPPGESDVASVEFCPSLVAEAPERRPLPGDNAKWIN